MFPPESKNNASPCSSFHIFISRALVSLQSLPYVHIIDAKRYVPHYSNTPSALTRCKKNTFKQTRCLQVKWASATLRESDAVSVNPDLRPIHPVQFTVDFSSCLASFLLLFIHLSYTFQQPSTSRFCRVLCYWLVYTHQHRPRPCVAWCRATFPLLFRVPLIHTHVGDSLYRLPHVRIFPESCSHIISNVDRLKFSYQGQNKRCFIANWSQITLFMPLVFLLNVFELTGRTTCTQLCSSWICQGFTSNYVGSPGFIGYSFLSVRLCLINTRDTFDFIWLNLLTGSGSAALHT